MERKKRILIRGAVVLLFLSYLAILVYLVFFSERYGRIPGNEDGVHYNLKPFAEIRRFLTYREALGIRYVIVNLAGNVLAFIPLGFFPPLLYHVMRKMRRVLLLGFLVSLMVETTQLSAGVGSFDVDDIILNTCGTVIGFLLYRCFFRIRRRHYG